MIGKANFNDEFKRDAVARITERGGRWPSALAALQVLLVSRDRMRGADDSRDCKVVMAYRDTAITSDLKYRTSRLPDNVPMATRANGDVAFASAVTATAPIAPPIRKVRSMPIVSTNFVIKGLSS